MVQATYEANGKRICVTCNWPVKECACAPERQEPKKQQDLRSAEGLMGWLAEESIMRNRDANESHKEAMNSYGAGYDRGYSDALIAVLKYLNGEDE